jgi:hypothetical protein
LASSFVGGCGYIVLCRAIKLALVNEIKLNFTGNFSLHFIHIFQMRGAPI